ncbi:Gp49 family protein [Pseudomonas aeruginosa]|uniref:Gp49 family protein n=1 Tax=Pseudomonas aeruginosa TaxID=287 RepID=UPI002246FBBE|nr:Gp49 family protein [Pseudomonas aeruginosa]MCX2515808.1 Gp49 family protein [Pseudomonas aeruginosa]
MTPSEQDKALEAQILAKGLTAPRVLPEQIDDLVNQLSFHTYVIPGTTVTVAAAIAPGNFVVAIGKAGAASAENFDEMVGRNRAISRAKDAARGQLWELECYRLKRNLLDLQEIGGLEHLLEIAASMPADLDAVSVECAATPAALLAQLVMKPVPCCIGAGCSGACGARPASPTAIASSEAKAPKAEIEPAPGV